MTYFLVAGHFTPTQRAGYRVGVPRKGFWREVINTNSQFYGGSGVGNNGGVQAEPIPAHGFDHSVSLTLPPNSTTILKWVQED
jgi:1,4-alpha-glucan branching enzyme